MVKILRHAIVVLAFGTLVACASSSSEQSAADQVAPVVAANSAADDGAETPVIYANKDRRVCRRYAPTGSRISQKICKKQSEWEAISKNASQAGSDAQRRGTYSNDTGN